MIYIIMLLNALLTNGIELYKVTGFKTIAVRNLLKYQPALRHCDCEARSRKQSVDSSTIKKSIFRA